MPRTMQYPITHRIPRVAVVGIAGRGMLAKLALCASALPTTITAQGRVRLTEPALVASNTAFDSDRGRLLVLDDSGQLFEYEGTELLHRSVATPNLAPPPRTAAAMAARNP